MDYRATSSALGFRAGVTSCVGWAGAAEMAGQPHGSSRSPARGFHIAGMSRKPAGGGGIIWSSLHPAGPVALVPTLALCAVLNLWAKLLLALADVLADAAEGLR